MRGPCRKNDYILINAQVNMDYEALTLLELKKLCKQRGLKISGTKDEVVIRLMEYDEMAAGGGSQAPVFQQVGTPMVMPMHGAQQIMIPQKNSMYQTLGTFVVLYALVRIGWSMLWTLNNEQMIGWLLAPVGFFIGIGFLMGGALIHQEYKNGILLTLCVLVVSGFLSIAFHADSMSDMNPVTLIWGDSAMFMTSILCSFTCFAIVGLPLLLGDGNMKPGWPPSLQRIFDGAGKGDKKRQVACGSCNEKLKIPAAYSGNIQCPSCKSTMKV